MIIPVIRLAPGVLRRGQATKGSCSPARPGCRCITATSGAGSGCRRSSAAGLPAIHFHDLRHTGNTLAASAGATLRELMDRMGHDSERAAMVYLHGSDARQHQIADTLSKLAKDELKRAARPGGPPGSDRARNGHGTGNEPREDHRAEPGNRV